MTCAPFPIVALLAVALLAGPAAADGSDWLTGTDDARLRSCLDQIERDPDAALEEARGWAAEQGGAQALFCAAAAEAARGRPDRGAALFERLARGAPSEARAMLWSHAGNAWLLAGDAARARAAFDQAVALAGGAAELRIDRARALAALGDWRRAEEDLSAALDIAGDQPLALALRAETRLRQGAFDLAVRDAERALALAPDSVDAALSLGRAREAQRLKRPPD